MLFAAVYAGGAGARARRRSRRASWRRRCRAGAYEWNAGRFMHDSGWGTGSPGSDGLHVAPGLHREQLFALRHEPPPAPGGSCATAVAWPSPRRACRCPSVKPRFPRKAAYYAASSTSFPHPCGARKSGGGARFPAAKTVKDPGRVREGRSLLELQSNPAACTPDSRQFLRRGACSRRRNCFLAGANGLEGGLPPDK